MPYTYSLFLCSVLCFPVSVPITHGFNDYSFTVTLWVWQGESSSLVFIYSMVLIYSWSFTSYRFWDQFVQFYEYSSWNFYLNCNGFIDQLEILVISLMGLHFIWIFCPMKLYKFLEKLLTGSSVVKLLITLHWYCIP